MGRARGANAKLAGIFETIYGTPPTAAGNYRSFPFVSSALGAEQALQEDDLLGQGREGFDPTYDVVVNDGDIVVPVDVRYFGFWLKLLLGAPATDDTGDPVFSHLFTSGKASLPSMSIETQMPEVPSYAMSYGLVANTMRIQLQRSGKLNATFGMIAKGESAPTGTSAAGTLMEALAVDRFAQAVGEIRRNGATLGSIVSAEINFTNNYDKVETIRPDGEIEGADAANARATGTITSRFANLTLAQDATNQTPVDLVWKWTFGASHSLEIACPRVFLPRVKRPITGPAGVQATFNWQASGQGAPCLSATLVNDLEAY